jgi:hypothetical protein
MTNCDWTNPGVDSFRDGGRDLGDAISRLPIDYIDKIQLKKLVANQNYTEIATITQEGIEGFLASYTNLRYMAFGKNKVCKNVTMKWEPSRVERGLIYCTPNACIIIPTVCNNISLVDRHLKKAFELPEKPRTKDVQPEKEEKKVRYVPEPSSSLLVSIALIACMAFGLRRKVD